jgi:integrase
MRRSHERATFSSEYGFANVYTRRHIDGCSLVAPDQNHCACPKWIYAKPVGGKREQHAAGTPSFTEACELARKKLRSFDPEIRAARQANEKISIPIREALEQYFQAVDNRGVTPAFVEEIRRVFIPLERPRIQGRGRKRTSQSLFEYLEEINRTAREPIVRLDQITFSVFENWVGSWKLGDLTRAHRRQVAKGFFKWAQEMGLITRLPVGYTGRRKRVKRGNRCGHFTDEQYEKMLAVLPFYNGATTKATNRKYLQLPANYHARLRAFIELGRWGGMALADLVLFNPSVMLGKNNVLTYQRRKSEQIATVLLDPAVAARLRVIPAEEDSLSDQPFRLRSQTEIRTRHKWRERFQRLCAFAEIGAVETQVGSTKNPHPHMLRDTFAIDAITRGVALDNVAKMLGHASVEMTQKSYLFWIKKRIDHCIEDQRLALARVDAPAVPAVLLRDPGGTLVH